jgi:lysophospholipase L1-like esterase
MKNYIYKLSSLLVLAAFAVSCEPEIEVPAPQSGGADFSNYIAVGNSLTAGYADNGLYAESQMTSYPALIAQQMNEIVPSEFVQPDIPGNGSGYLYVSSLDLSQSTPDVGFGEFPADPAWLTQLTGPFNNLGVPGIRVKEITVPGYGASPTAGNPYFYRMLGGKAATTSYLQMVQESSPTFFTSWLGNNDVLGYATSGGAYGVAGLPGTGLYGLTPPAEFQLSYDALMATLTADGAKGVLVTIPDITTIPFFTTVPWDGIVIDEATANLANGYYAAGIDTAVESQVQAAVMLGAVYQQAYETAKAGGASDAEAAAAAAAFVASPAGQTAIAQLNAAYEAEMLPEAQQDALEDAIDTNTQATIAALKAAGIYPVFVAGANGFVIEVPKSPTNPLGIRQMKAGEYVLLTALLDGQLEGLQALAPKPTQYILSSEEVANLTTYTEDFNDIIRSYSGADIAIFESNDALLEIQDGIFVDGVSVDATFLLGGAFSLDGVHLTPRGYAIVANEIIKTINTKFGSTISPVNINNYRAVILP